MNAARHRRAVWWMLAALGLAGALVGGWLVQATRLVAVESGPARAAATPDARPLADAVARGAYLARAGNCMACHTARGGAPYAGGHAVQTPFGVVYGSNLTPHDTHGLGRWTADDFWRALRHGQSRDGRLLIPAFPYAHYSGVSRQDADDLFAFLRALPPDGTPSRQADLPFPFSTQWALAVWRGLYFDPAPAPSAAAMDTTSASVARGAYLVQTLGHCGACHSARDALGGTRQSGLLRGSLMPLTAWYAPSLLDPTQAGVQGWPLEDVVGLLREGRSPRAWATGPMGDIVQHSLQHLTDTDLRAMARYLSALPVETEAAPIRLSVAGRTPEDRPVAAGASAARTPSRGAALYRSHCAACHGDSGQGQGRDVPPLAGNRSVTLAQPANLLQSILHGGFSAQTAHHPRPWGMPPFVLALDDEELAAVATYVRSAWGHQASEVTPLMVNRLRQNP